jgi:hypothetical protein
MMRRAILASAVLLETAVHAQVPPTQGVSKFAVRSDLSNADAVNAVLAQVAEPLLVHIDDDTNPEAATAERCGGRTPKLLGIEVRPGPDGRQQFARISPCAKQIRNARIKARSGDTLETIAVRFGMRPSSTATLKVIRVTPQNQRPAGKALTPGDIVVAALAPDWTYFTARPGTVSDRSSLVGMVAAAMGCGAESPDKCLARRSVYVVDRTPIPKVSHPAQDPASQSMQPVEQPAPRAANKPGVATREAKPRIANPTRLIFANQPQDPPPAPPAIISRVAPGQWPYDRDLVAALLASAAASHNLLPSQIAIAEGGLGSEDGRPLPPDAFAHTDESAPANGVDDDGNGYVDDLIGAGVAREDVAPQLGSVALCAATPAPVYSTWAPEPFELASHGTIVSSIAAGLALRSNLGAIAALPKLLFFRMAHNACDLDADTLGGPVEAISAAEYLTGYENTVLNLSFVEPGSAGDNLAQTLGRLLKAPNAPIMVAAAGNYTGNIDDARPCPACLGNVARYPDIPSSRVLVVGAADATLTLAQYSGFGDQTVRLYAPGEPLGAIDIMGADASTRKAATSYATALVSFAAATARALGIQDQARIRNRLLLSTWPLLDDAGRPIGKAGGPMPLGVLDLVKVAAIRFQAVERIERLPDNRQVLRTYVGRITSGLEGVCPGTAVTEASMLSIRLAAAAPDGSRTPTIALRHPDPQTLYPMFRATPPCHPVGSLTIDDLRDHVVVIPMSDVTQILFRGKLP